MISCVSTLVTDHDAHAFALTEHARLYANFQSDRAAITGQESAVVAFNDEGDVIGLIAWETEDSDKTAWIALVAVRDYRQRKGVFRVLWRELKIQVCAAGCVSIRLGVAADNAAARAAYESVGLRRTFEIYEGSPAP